MESENYHFETKILKGSDVLENLCDECLSLGDKVLIVFSENAIKQSGVYARVVSLFNIRGIAHITYECTTSNYNAEEIEKASKLGSEQKVQLILSIGDEELTYFTKIVAHDVNEVLPTASKKPKHLPIINVSSLLKSSGKADFGFVKNQNYYADIKPSALFLDYEI